MEPFESALQHLSGLYRDLHETMAAFDEPGPGKDTTAPLDQVLQNRELFSQIKLMDSHVATLAAEWKNLRDRLDPASRSRIRQLAEDLRNQASTLKPIVDRRVSQIEYTRAHLKRKLAEIQKGEQFLRSVKPIRFNYPKFIDSLG